jgi:hypothetical protein
MGAAAVLAIIALVGVAHWRLRSRLTSDPTDFLPTSVRLAVATDIRPQSPAMARVRNTWNHTDVDELAVRATELAQDLVDWTGLKLELDRNASRWFGGELVAAATVGVDGAFLAPRSWVLIARVTNARRARGDLDRAASTLAREAGWRRSVIKPDGQAITTWVDQNGTTHFAYATREGCLLVSASETVIEECLAAADDPARSLVASDRFAEAMTALPQASLVWCYASAPPLVQSLRDMLPQLQGGWLGTIRHYTGPRTRGSTTAAEGDEDAVSGTLALAATPEVDGLRLHAHYQGSVDQARTASDSQLPMLAEVLPASTIACALLHNPAGWLTAVHGGPRGGDREQGAGPRLPSRLAFIPHLLPMAPPPTDIMVALLPRGPESHTPAAVFGMIGEPPVQLPQWLTALMPEASSAVIDGITIYATDGEAIRQCESAADDRADRLDLDIGADVRFRAWARPGELSGIAPSFEEVQISLHEGLDSAQLEIYVRAQPARLLGGG